MASKEVSQFDSTIRKEISAIEQSTLEARQELEQKILDAQLGKSPAEPDEQKPSATQSPSTPNKPV